VGAVLEGGYDLDALSASVVATLEALSNGREPPRPAQPNPLSEQAAQAIGRYWRL
jgi:acetoin utilization deacetylase AcuC-like enzyme